MKELIRLVGYSGATIAMILLVIAVAKTDISPEGLVYSALFVVIVLPVIIAILMAKREKRNA